MKKLVVFNVAAMAVIAAATAIAAPSAAMPWQTLAGIVIFAPVFAVAFAAAIFADRG